MTTLEKTTPKKRTAVEIVMISPQDPCVYTLSQHTPRGFAVIVNITKNREGSRIDVRKMTELFEWMNYKVIPIEDETKEVRHIESYLSNTSMLFLRQLKTRKY